MAFEGEYVENVDAREHQQPLQNEEDQKKRAEACRSVAASQCHGEHV